MAPDRLRGHCAATRGKPSAALLFRPAQRSAERRVISTRLWASFRRLGLKGALQHASDPAARLAARAFTRTAVTWLAEGLGFVATARERRRVGGPGPPALLRYVRIERPIPCIGYREAASSPSTWGIATALGKERCKWQVGDSGRFRNGGEGDEGPTPLHAATYTTLLTRSEGKGAAEKMASLDV